MKIRNLSAYFVTLALFVFNLIGCKTAINTGDAESDSSVESAGVKEPNFDRLPGTMALKCIDGTRGFKIQKDNSGKLTGYFKDFEARRNPTQDHMPLALYECKTWLKGDMTFRCYGKQDQPGDAMEEIDFFKNGHGTPMVQFNIVNNRNEQGGGDDTFSLNCDPSSAIGFKK